MTAAPTSDWTAIAVALIAMVTAIASPYILARQLNRNAAKVREADWARQDIVADRLLAANERMAEDSRRTEGKIDEVHRLVNSNMTAAMEGQRDAMVRELAMMREVVTLKQVNGHEPSIDTLATIKATEKSIDELDVVLADRRRSDD